MTNIVYIRMRIEAKFCDRAKNGGGIFRFYLDGFGGCAAGDSNFGKFRGELVGGVRAAHLYDFDNREVAIWPHQVADKFAVSVRRLRDLGDRNAEIGKHLLDDRARVEWEPGLQDRTPSLEPADLLGHQLDIEQVVANLDVGGVGRAREDVGLGAFARLGERRDCGQPISKWTKVISPNSEFESSQRIAHRRRIETLSRIRITITFHPGSGKIRLRDLFFSILETSALPHFRSPSGRTGIASARSFARRASGADHLAPPNRAHLLGRQIVRAQQPEP